MNLQRVKLAYKKIYSRQERVMSIGDSGHCVDLKVLVRTNASSVLDCTPVCPTWFSVIEPFVCHMLNVV